MTDVLIGFFIATLISAIFTTRLFRLYNWYALNSMVLGFIALKIGFSIDDKAMIITGFLTLFLKFLAIPYILKHLSIKFYIKRDIMPFIKVHYLVMIVPIILVFTFYLITPIIKNFAHSNYVALAVSALFLSLILIMEHKNIAAKIIGFLSIENTLFLLGISSTNGMPMLIELGIFVDLLMLIVIINLLFKYQGE
jgi:hydrogenase-4 component E